MTEIRWNGRRVLDALAYDGTLHLFSHNEDFGLQMHAATDNPAAVTRNTKIVLYHILQDCFCSARVFHSRWRAYDNTLVIRVHPKHPMPAGHYLIVDFEFLTPSEEDDFREFVTSLLAIRELAQ